MFLLRDWIGLIVFCLFDNTLDSRYGVLSGRKSRFWTGVGIKSEWCQGHHARVQKPITKAEVGLRILSWQVQEAQLFFICWLISWRVLRRGFSPLYLYTISGRNLRKMKIINSNGRDPMHACDAEMMAKRSIKGHLLPTISNPEATCWLQKRRWRLPKLYLGNNITFIQVKGSGHIYFLRKLALFKNLPNYTHSHTHHSQRERATPHCDLHSVNKTAGTASHSLVQLLWAHCYRVGQTHQDTHQSSALITDFIWWCRYNIK